MSDRRRPFEEWEAIGTGFKELNNLLCKVRVMVGKYGYLSYSDKLDDVARRISNIKSELEARLFKEYPERADTHVFYGKVKRTGKAFVDSTPTGSAGEGDKNKGGQFAQGHFGLAKK